MAYIRYGWCYVRFYFILAVLRKWLLELWHFIIEGAIYSEKIQKNIGASWKDICMILSNPCGRYWMFIIPVLEKENTG